MTGRLTHTALTTALLALLPAGCAQNGSAAPSPRDDTKLARFIGGKTAGAPQRCLDPNTSRRVEPVGTRIVLFVEGETVWRNDLTGSCAGLRFGDTLVTRQLSGRLCEGDLAQTADLKGGGGITGGCAIGAFTPYR